MKAKQEKRTIILVAVVVLTAAAIRLVNLNLLTENTLLRDFIRVVLQISLISAWGLSLYRRIKLKLKGLTPAQHRYTINLNK